MIVVIDDDRILKLFKTLKVKDTSLYPNIKKVVVARNFNAVESKRLLYDFLDIYTKDFVTKKIATTPPGQFI